MEIHYYIYYGSGFINKLFFITQNQNVIKSTSNESPPVFHIFFVFIHGLVCDKSNEMFGATHA